MTAPIFNGVGVALLTIFDSSQNLDAGATAELASRLVDLGVRAVLVAGRYLDSGSLLSPSR